MKKWIVLILLGGFLLPSICTAIDLKQSKFTQVVNNVEIISATDKTRHTAAVNDIFSMPDVLRTGPDSRAELDAVDGTITRVGANTIFSFDPLNRTIDLQQGSLLFHSPKGKGGGTIRTGSATASVIGTTIIITATPNGGFKLLDLEGQAEVRFLNGINQTLEPGQMTFILPSGQTSPILVFRLDSETKGSTLVSGFTTPLDSQSKINSEITQQLLQILNGTAADTGLIVGNNATENTVQTVQGYLNSQQSSTPPPTGFEADGNIVGISDHVPSDKLTPNYQAFDPTHPLDPNQVQNAPFTPPTGVDSFTEGLQFLGIVNPVNGGSPASGFVGVNVNIDTAKVDLSSFKSDSDFDIMASKNLNVWQSVDFTPGYAPVSVKSLTSGQPDTIALLAGAQMLIASGSTLEVDTGTFGLVADSFGVLDTATGLVGVGGQNTLEDVNLINNAGDVDVLSLLDFTFASGSINGGSDGSELSTGGDVEIQSDGTLTLGSESTVSLAYLSRYNFTIDSGANVKLLSTGQMDILDSQIDSVAGNIEADAGGAIYINGSYLDANSEDSLGGNVTIDGAGVQIFGTYIYGYGGNVYITSTGAAVDIDSSEINAAGYILPGLLANTTPTIVGGVVNITGGGDVGIYDYSTIDAGGNVNITSGDASSGGGDLNIESSTVYAGYDSSFGGSLDLNAENGAVYISGSHLSANEAYSVGGNVTIAGDGVQIYNTSIYGGAVVDVASSGTLSVGTDPAFDVTITAGSDATLSAAGAVDMTDTGITAGDDVSITSDGTASFVSPGNLSISESYTADNINISGSSITSDNGDVSIVNNGGFSVSGTTVSISDSDINFDNISISDSSITADNGGVLIEYDGSLNRSDSISFTISGSTLNANDIFISGSSITANYGDVDIWDFKNEDNTGPDSVTEDSDVYTSDISITSDSTITANNGNVDIKTQNGGIDLENSTIYADDCIRLCADAGVTIDNDIITAGEGVKIHSASDSNNSFDGNMYLSGDTITAGTDATISGDGNVAITDSTITAEGGDVMVSADDGMLTIDADHDFSDKYYEDISAGGDVTLDGGTCAKVTDTVIYADEGVTLTGENGNVKVIDADIETGSGDIDITAYNGTLTLDSGSANYGVYIEAGGAVNLSADYDVDIYDSTIYADNGDVDITSQGTTTVILENAAVGSIDIENTDIYAGQESTVGGSVNINAYNGSVYLSGDDIEAYAGVVPDLVSISDGDVTIYGSGTVDVENSYVYATGNLNIESGDTLTLGQNSSDSISALAGPSRVSINANGVVNLTSDNADVDVYDYAIYANGSDDSGNGINVSAGGNVDIEDSLDIYAEKSGVNIVAAGNVYLYDDEIYASYKSGTGGISIVSSGSTVDVDYTYLDAEGDVNIESSDTLTLEDSSEIDSYGLDAISLTSDNADVDVYDSSLYAYSGSVNVGAAGNVNIENSDIYAYDNVNITSSTGSAPAPDAFIPAPGSVDIEYSYIYAGYNISSDEVSLSTDGGSVNVTAWNGDVDLYDDEINAYSGAINDGDVNIYASGSVDLEDVYRLYADDSIEIEGVNTVTVEDGSDLDAYNGNVSLTSDNADVNVYDSEIYSDYGNVNINAAGSVYVSDGNIQAGDYSDTIGDVNIHASSGTADFENTDIEASGGVYIESSGTLNLNYSKSNDDDSGYHEIYSGGGPVNLKSDYGDVDINNYDVYAEGGNLNINAGGGPALSGAVNTGGNVDIETTDFQVYGSAYLNATGNVYVDNSYFDMYEGGDVNVNADGNIDVLYTDGSGSGSVSLTAGGYVNAYDYDLNMGSFDVAAGTYADFGADQYVDIYGSTIVANGGDVDITGNSAGVDIDSTTITATGDINLTAGGGYHVDSLSSGGHVVPAYVAPSAAGGKFVVLGNFTPETFVEPAPISAPVDNVDVVSDTSTYVQSATVDLEANIDAHIQNNSRLVSDSGNMMVNSGGTEEVDSSYIEANGSVYLTAVGSVSLSDSLASSDVYSDIYADNGDVDIQSSGSTVDIENTYIYSHGSVNIEGSGTLTLGYNSGNSIAAYNGNVSLTSDNADVDVDNYDIYSDYGNVYISAAGNVNLSGDSVHSGYDSETGDVKIQSLAGTVDLEAAYIGSAGNVDILSYDTLTLGNTSGNEIYANGWVNLSSTTGNVDIDRYSIYTYGSDIDGNGVTISAAGTLTLDNYEYVEAYNGSVNLNAGGDVNIDNSDYIYTGDGDLDISAGGSISMNDNSDVEANNGSVNMSAGGTIYLYNNELYGNNADVNITALGVSSTIDIEDTYISAYGNINIESSGTLTLGSLSAWTIDAGNAISLKSDNADVVINTDYELDADGSDINGNGITISAGRNVDIENDGDIYADYGGVKIAAVGSVYLYDDEIYAGYDDTDNGNLTIASSGSTVDVDDTYLDAEGDVNIESGDTLTLENSSEIDSYGYNGISLTSDNADVDVYDSFLYAYYGNVDIYATGNAGTIDLQSDDISAYGNVNVESDSTLTLGNSETGGDTIYAGSGIYLSSNNGDVDVYNSSIYGGFANNNDGFDGTVDGISILDGSTITADGAVNLNSYGATVSIYAPNGNINIGHTTINPGGGIGISDSTITAKGSDINGNGVSIYSDGYFYVGGRSDTLFSDNIEGNNISISGSTITANNGGISIVNDAYASTVDAAGFNVENTTLIYGDVNISSSSTITADNGNINISTSSLELFNASSAYSSDISLNDISIYDSTISASGGNVTVSAGGYLTTGTEIVAADKSGIAAALASPYAVSINASGDISLYGYSGANLDVTTAEAGGKFDLESDNFADVYNSSLIADTGDLHIYGDYGNVDVEYSTIKATQGNVNIGAGFTDANNNNSELFTLNGVTITAGEFATLTSSGGIHVDDSGITAASITLETLYGAANLDANYFGSSTLTAATGDTDIYADNGNVDVEGSTIKATLGNVNIGAGFKDGSDNNSETLALDGASITAGKSVTVSSPGTASLTGGSITGNNNVNVNAGSGITINGTAITADDTTYGNITLTSTAGQTTIQNGASMTAYTLTVNSPDGILIDGTSGTISGNTMNLTTSLGDASDDTSGGHTVTVQNDDLGQFQTVNIQAHTVNLSSDNFSSSSSYNFTSFYHGYHINDGIVPGFVNFINDTLDHVAIENTGTSGLANQSNNGGIGLGGAGSGIHIN